ncbi:MULTISPECIES: DUF6904 family protein [Pelosinus]|uniref:Uncharacterized protein n=1 Tax=Pelosinus fermentans B4 TaxID=1149862 RepID=I9B5K0_9FIRM|nr:MULTISPECIES: hypothetical protein [Pelosinus]EIW20392.1 hypothetical protein FB4_2356 [Pelosinus fermentans B4]EIW25549.1 hypothetical protein FA11_2171 [Pelosinus fermentans A11]OAM93271.1 hypothetical protein FR7_01287 [Pelosinus fermentans DSM 17108]SDQ72309.1 hypothetical protein SAMN04515679_1351 [Pelosinus fermentans]
MIFVKHTPNHAGVAIYGDCLDFEELYGALHDVVGKENQYVAYQGVRIRVLGFCYELRHALMGNREFEFVENGMDENRMKELAMITPKKNIYIGTHILWPEILFVIMCLSDFILLRQKKNKYPEWDANTAAVHKFQAAVVECLKQVVTEASYKRILNMITHDYTWFYGYTIQYIDILNGKFLAMNKEKRLKSVAIIAKRIAEPDDEYREVREEVLEEALKYNCPADEIQYDWDYPENIQW